MRTICLGGFNGAGACEGQSRPNIVRALVGESSDAAETDAVVVPEASLDGCPGEWMGHCLVRLMAEGVRDAYCVPIYMKKQRPGVVLTAIGDLRSGCRTTIQPRSCRGARRPAEVTD